MISTQHASNIMQVYLKDQSNTLVPLSICLLYTSTMGIVNIIVVAVLLLCIIKGYQVGFAQKLLSICSFFVSGICAWIISGMLDQLLQMAPHIENETVDLLFYNVDVYKRQVINRIFFAGRY